MTTASSRSGGFGERPLFVAAICASAFLILLVQPMVGKRILPWYGGAPAVWTLCLAFYQSMLFLGYSDLFGLLQDHGETGEISNSSVR